MIIYKAIDKDSLTLFPDFYKIKLHTYNSSNRIINLFCKDFEKIIELNNEDIYYNFVFNNIGQFGLIAQNEFERKFHLLIKKTDQKLMF